MRFTYPFFSLLLALSCFSQPSPINRRAVVLSGLATSTILDPSQITSGLYRWWRASDVTANVTLSNQWNDRVINAPMYMMNLTLSPTNGPIGARFIGTQLLTNQPAGGGYDVGQIEGGTHPADTFFFIFTPDGTAGTERIFDDWNNSGSSRGPEMVGAILKFCGNQSCPPETICTFAAGTTNDVIAALTITNTIWYTNGIPCITNTYAAVNDWTFGSIGGSGAVKYHGSTEEVGIYTGKVFTATLAASIHKYATNRYKYSP